jgi:L(+)-tartrate dehydratase beta subunit
VRKKDDGKFEMVSIGPTTSMRMEKFEREFIKQTGVKLIVGKGGMGPETQPAVRKARPCMPSSRAAARCWPPPRSKKSKRAEWQDLGMPETLWVNRVKEFGPLIISIDTKGNNLIEQNKAILQGKKKVIDLRLSFRTAVAMRQFSFPSDPPSEVGTPVDVRSRSRNAGRCPGD